MIVFEFTIVWLTSTKKITVLDKFLKHLNLYLLRGAFPQKKHFLFNVWVWIASFISQQHQTQLSSFRYSKLIFQNKPDIVVSFELKIQIYVNVRVYTFYGHTVSIFHIFHIFHNVPKYLNIPLKNVLNILKIIHKLLFDWFSNAA